MVKVRMQVRMPMQRRPKLSVLNKSAESEKTPTLIVMFAPAMLAPANVMEASWPSTPWYPPPAVK